MGFTSIKRKNNNPFPINTKSEKDINKKLSKLRDKKNKLELILSEFKGYISFVVSSEKITILILNENIKSKIQSIVRRYRNLELVIIN